VRHRSFVLGTVNSTETTVAGFYGIYAPMSGPVELKQPEGGGAGINYLVPLCMPDSGEINAYVDTRSYQISTEHTSSVQPIFRNTLKKVQGRWTGERPGITGNAAYNADANHELKGEV